MESLVTLLVFSVGMLGLGQLQARLWVNSGDIHSANLAFLIAENVTELIEINTLILEPNTEKPSLAAYVSLPGFTYHQSVRALPSTTTTEVQVSWHRPSGTDSATLQTGFSTGLLAVDAAWLLSAQN